MIKRTSKLWIAVGAAVTMTAGGVGAQPAHQHGKPEGATTQSQPMAGTAPSSEGGEGGEGAADSLDPRVRFFRDLSLIRGHLLVGDELVNAGLWAEALPHFHHPVEELYTWIGSRLKVQGQRQFDSSLKALAQSVQAKNATAYTSALKVARQRIDAAEQGMRKFAVPYLQVRIDTISAILTAAASEYKEAIENGRISKPVEYQDSRGFVLEASRQIEALAQDLEKKDPAALQATRAALVELKKAWPGPVPAETPVKPSFEVEADVARVGLATSPLRSN